ncbi:uncharacterized protein F5Z01DRAFT_525121 [Emericellopsis atlantica]|uniref:Secreted protein n=1 Tax=Emericellopsis atlantica TaxID=2614577 RepID=A0A9P7ZQD9_9HYPO|nr:uncharacterized protein F5Z01DRAFT_525121 [Emericellopsis atlantica]KAG9255922.1 hypothetical protein F5Z01DRAFT_525121 [Emericellopsis atlantica]
MRIAQLTLVGLVGEILHAPASGAACARDPRRCAGHPPHHAVLDLGASGFPIPACLPLPSFWAISTTTTSLATHEPTQSQSGLISIHSSELTPILARICQPANHLASWTPSRSRCRRHCLAAKDRSHSSTYHGIYAIAGGVETGPWIRRPETCMRAG